MTPDPGLPTSNRLRAIWRFIAIASQKTGTATSFFLAAVFGKFDWQAPGWLLGLRGTLRRCRAWLFSSSSRIAVIFTALLAVIAGFIWYIQRPKPHYVDYTVEAPLLTTYDDKGVPDFQPLQIHFAEPAAPLSMVEKRVSTGIEISPAIAGTWFWSTDKELRFTPRNDWPVGVDFTVKFAHKGFFAPQVQVEHYASDFTSQAFTAKIADSEFYQDPRDPSLKKLVATVAFSHPVDPVQFEKRVSLIAAADAEYLGLTPDGRRFTVVYDKLRLTAHIHSAPLTMPRDDTHMTVRIEDGVRSARGGGGTPARIESVVTIPGRSSLRFSGAEMTLVDNARYEPEQVLMLTSSSPVSEAAFAGKITAWILPVRSPDQPKEDKKPFHWDDQSQVGAPILAKSTPLALTYVASDAGGDTSHGFKFLAPPGRYVYLVVKDGVEGIGGYVSGKPYAATFHVHPYKQALNFLGQGALLSVSGDRKVGFLIRDIDKVEVEIGRVLPNQIQHLASRMWDFSKPFTGDIADSIVERFAATRDYSGHSPGKPVYDSIDLAQYMQDKAQNRRGLFLLHLRSASPRKPQSTADDEEEDGDAGPDESGNDQRSVEDSRLILITDLGFIVKLNTDGSRDVFVQSIHTGQPVAGARVEVDGANGLPVAATTTDAVGRATLPALENLVRERNPLLILAQKDQDFSFMPLRSNGRTLDLSRFDTGGVVNAASARQVSAYLFSDRGIYRPGETAHLGIITRAADWKVSLDQLPISVEVTDPRGNIVSRNALKLTSSAFSEITFVTENSSPTGTWEATAWLVKDERHRETLGSTTFKVQEFEPDRMKVRLDLSDKSGTAWLTTAEVKARVTAAQLFGAPAAGRKVQAEMSLSPALPGFSRYPDYRFQIGQALPEPFHETLAATLTDDKGNADLSTDLARFTGRAYRLNLLARVFEADGGRSVASQAGAIVSDAKYLVGVKEDGDLAFVHRSTPRGARWMAVDSSLSLVAADGLKLEWVQRKYVSVLTQQDNKTYKYVSKLKEIVRETHAVKIPSGGASFAIPTQEPGDFVQILRNNEGAELNRLSYSVAGQANISRSLERDAELQVQLDKSSYAGGDQMEVSIRAPYIGSGLITIERERVFYHQWFHTATTSTVQHITLPKDFEGNGYVTVEFLRDPSSDEIFLSPLSWGVAPFSANLAARTETVKLTAPKEVKPGANLTIHVAPEEASRIAVLAVDEGILQVARYRNPDPLGYFFQKRMLQVQTSQILDLILPEFQRLLALSAPGGDADGGYSRHLNPFDRKHKPPVAWWSGLIDVGPAGRDLHYTVPDYFNGHLRIVAIAVSPRRVGVAETGTDVKGDFILTPNVPAMIAPGDEFTVSVGVYNNLTGGSNAVRLEAQVSSELTPVGATQTDLQIAPKKEAAAEFRFKANAMPGAASLKFTARSGGSASGRESRMEESVSVRPASAWRTQLTLGKFETNTTVVPLTRSMFPEKRDVDASVSAIPLVWGQGLTSFLDQYPYPCTEQLVSKGFAALMLASRPEFGVTRTRDPLPLANTFSVLQSRANDQGGFGLWTSSPETAEFPTVYAAQFLIESRERGQKIPTEMLAALNQWLIRFATTPAPTLDDARLRAYAVYLLARQGIKPVAAISNVEQELSHRYSKIWQTDMSAAWLAAAYRLMQRNDDADRIVKTVPWSQQKKDWTGDSYYTDDVHDAELLYVLSKHFPARAAAVPPAVLENIAHTISGNRVSSLSAAYTLLALDAYAKAQAQASGMLTIAAVAKDGREQRLTATPGAMPKASVPDSAAKVRFSQEGLKQAYYTLSESGFDRNPPAAESNQGIEIFREFLDAKGKPVTQVKVGDEFFVRLRARASRQDRIHQVAVVDLLPGGIEPVLEIQPPADSSAPGDDPAMARQRGAAVALPIGIPTQSTWLPQHIDVRDDRILLYGDLQREAATFVYRVRATNAGLFQSPPPYAEGMYDRTVSGTGQAGHLEVVK